MGIWGGWWRGWGEGEEFVRIKWIVKTITSHTNNTLFVFSDVEIYPLLSHSLETEARNVHVVLKKLNSIGVFFQVSVPGTYLFMDPLVWTLLSGRRFNFIFDGGHLLSSVTHFQSVYLALTKQRRKNTFLTSYHVLYDIPFFFGGGVGVGLDRRWPLILKSIFFGLKVGAYSSLGAYLNNYGTRSGETKRDLLLQDVSKSSDIHLTTYHI